MVFTDAIVKEVRILSLVPESPWVLQSPPPSDFVLPSLYLTASHSLHGGRKVRKSKGSETMLIKEKRLTTSSLFQGLSYLYNLYPDLEGKSYSRENTLVLGACCTSTLNAPPSSLTWTILHIPAPSLPFCSLFWVIWLPSEVSSMHPHHRACSPCIPTTVHALYAFATCIFSLVLGGKC